MPRNRPTPAETASFRFCGIALMMVFAQPGGGDDQRQHAGDEHEGERLLPRVFVAPSTSVKAKNALSPMPGASAIG